MKLIRPVVTYTRETWAHSVRVTNNSLVFERQILRKIYGPIKPKGGKIIRNNKELQNLTNGEYIDKYIKSQRIKLWGHLNRMEDTKLVKEY
jgi:hypothetical protein